MVNVGVVGATGYTGEDIVKIISRHPNARIAALSAIIEKPSAISEIFPSLRGICDVVCGELDVGEVSRLRRHISGAASQGLDEVRAGVSQARQEGDRP